MSIFTRQIKTTITRDAFYLDGKINIDTDYFIKKIDQGVINSANNFKTNVKGLMTPWDYFIEDDKFLKIFLHIINNFEHHSCVNPCLIDWKLQDCWGLKEMTGHYTQKHEHLPCLLSGVIYLNNVEQELIFDDINIRLRPEAGSFAIFSSNLNHHTERNLEDKFKYALAFNLIEVKKL